MLCVFSFSYFFIRPFNANVFLYINGKHTKTKSNNKTKKSKKNVKTKKKQSGKYKGRIKQKNKNPFDKQKNKSKNKVEKFVVEEFTNCPIGNNYSKLYKDGIKKLNNTAKPEFLPYNHEDSGYTQTFIK